MIQNTLNGDRNLGAAGRGRVGRGNQVRGSKWQQGRGLELRHRLTPLARRGGWINPSRLASSASLKSSLIIRGQSELLFGHDRVFDRFAEAELQGRLGRNLDRLAGLRVAPLASLPFRENELPEPR